MPCTSRLRSANDRPGPGVDAGAAVILLGGPTASGKSDLARRLASDLGGVIVNADSMQVYADLAILTARPSREDEARLPHRLFGFLDAAVRCSAGLWLRHAREACREIAGSGRIPILVGGTGLYLKVFREGLAPVPAVPRSVRSRIRRRLADEGAEALHRHLLECDPDLASTIAPADGQRIARALEVFEATGTRHSLWLARRREGGWDGAAFQVSLLPPRPALMERCDRRFDAMLAAGALEEAARFAARQLDPSLPACRSVGLSSLLAHIEGRLTLAEATDAAKTATRRYARRQYTWFRHQVPDAFEVCAFGFAEEAGDVAGEARRFLLTVSDRPA